MGHLDNIVREDSLGFQGKLADTSVTIAEVLKEAGYFTIMTGKWHLGQQRGCTPWVRGFDRNLSLPAGGIYFPNQKGKENVPLWLNGQAKPKDSPEFGKNWYATDLWTEWSLKFIDEARQAGKPFFLYLAHCAPHFPLMAPQEDIMRYKGKYMKGWDALREERYRRQIEMGLIDPKWPLSERPPDSPAWESLPQAEKERYDHMMAVYAAMIDKIDKSVGKLVQGLKTRGAFDNTLLLFLSDNGGNAESGPPGRSVGQPLGGPDSDVFIGMNWATLNNTPFRRYKHFTHEGGISAPLVAHWPAGIKPGNAPAGNLRPAPGGPLSDTPAHLIDIMPTVVEVTGAQYPAEYKGKKIYAMEGVSLSAVFAGQALARKNPIFWEHEGNRAVRSGKWKLVSKFMEPWELYDIEADRTELHDLAAQQPEMARELASLWDAWARRTHTDPWIGGHRTNWGAEETPNGSPGARKKKGGAGKKKKKKAES